MKYLILQDFAGRPAPFIFPARVNHADMREQLPYVKVISAGSIKLQDGIFVCSPADTGLEVPFHEEDVEIINKAFSANEGNPENAYCGEGN